MNKAIFWDLLGTLGGDSRTLINQNFNFFKDTIPALKKSGTKSLSKYHHYESKSYFTWTYYYGRIY